MTAPDTTLAPRRFRPNPVAALFVLVGVAILAVLGTWQVQRLQWKSDLIRKIESRTDAPPVPLPAVVEDPESWDYRPVLVTGRFLHDKELYLGPRTLTPPRGPKQAGFHVLTPFARDDGSGILLVDRGFVPNDRRDPGTRAEGQVQGTVTIQGIARVPQGRAWMQPENRPAENFWFAYDLPAMAAATGLPGFDPLVMQAGPAENPGGLPVGGQTLVQIKNDHLSYAITWYGLALTLAIFFIVASYRRA
ncbi:SURF1 family protein [Aerophototrophica crusticola]|uniref:SURF1-like protein n=1 Tax=Aerophototrophica crusticola TaxID=1709002 RepID=A0A858R4W4_9PROT|nr:SURF1 family protein [Rhodospirillaceae bacterium B3]